MWVVIRGRQGTVVGAVQVRAVLLTVGELTMKTSAIAR